AVLWPVLERHRALARQRYRAELGRELRPTWDDPPGPPGPAPAGATIAEVHAAVGLVEPHFALVPTLPPTRLPAVAQALGKAGYRLTRLRPYALGKQVQVAALWTRDGRSGQWLLDVTPNQVQTRNAALGKDGWQPVDVAGYRTPAGERYAACWVRAGVG